MKLIRLCISILCLCALASCEKEEEPIVLPGKDASARLLSAAMGEKYLTQVFVNIATGEKWTAENESWDLQLESSADGYLIKMNGGKGVLIASAKDTLITSRILFTGVYRWDGASGIKDSLVLKDWCTAGRASHDTVYIIDRGPSAAPENRYYQFQLKSVTPSAYVIRKAEMDGSGAREIVITKDPSRLHVYFTFANGGKALNIEPDKNKWDFCFLRYRWVYYEFTPPLLYTVNGVHINTSRVSVAVDSTMQYSSITRTTADGMRFKDTRDVIGYDWKVPDFTATGVKYITRKYVSYVIRKKDNAAEVYKMHFLGFYDDRGVKGTPSFEYQLLD